MLASRPALYSGENHISISVQLGIMLHLGEGHASLSIAH